MMSAMYSAAIVRRRLLNVVAMVVILWGASLSCAGERAGMVTSQQWSDNNHYLFFHNALMMTDPNDQRSPEQAYQQFLNYLSGRSSDWFHFFGSKIDPLGGDTDWFGVRIRNTTEDTLYFYYRDLKTTTIDGTLFEWRRGELVGEESFGDRNAELANTLQERYFTYPLKLRPGEQVDLLLRFRADYLPSTTASLSMLYSQQDLAEGEDKLSILIWILIGSMLILGIVSLVASSGLDRWQFYLLAAIAVSATLGHLDLQGYLDTFLWPQYPWLKAKALLVTSGIFVCSTLLYVDRYLSFARVSRIAHGLLYLSISAIVAITLFSLLHDSLYVLLLGVANSLWMLTLICLALYTVFLCHRGYAPAQRFVWVWFGFFVTTGIIIAAMYLTNQLHYFVTVLSNLIVLVLSFFLFIAAVIEMRQQKQERDKAFAESRAKSDFMARMSHEIRTPMNGVIGVAELLADTDLDESQRNYVNVIYHSGKTLLNVINEILDFSKISAGKMKLELVESNLLDAIEDSVSIFLSEARNKGLVLLCDIDPRLPSMWLCDETRVRQVIFNLVGNAIKFTEQGEVVVTVDPLVSRPGVCISVADTGIGIDPEIEPSLFEAFSQGDVSISRRYGGTGLGLSICRQLVDLMGGSIRFSRVSPSGARFEVSLPLAIVGDASAAAAEGEDRRVLVIDRCVSFLRMARRQGGAIGLTVDTTENTHRGESMLREAQASGSDYALVLAALSIDTRLDQLVTCIRQLPQPPVLVILNEIAGAEVPEISGLANALLLRKPALGSELRGLFTSAMGKSLEVYTGSEDADDSATGSIDVPPLDSRGKRILVAEDNVVNFQVVSAMLEKLGFAIDWAEDGEKAVAKFIESNLQGQSTPYDLILMDCEMPGLDGLEATRQIRRKELISGVDPVPIVALTAHVTDDRIALCEEAGMDQYLSKPIQIEPLALKLNEVLG